MTPEVPPEKIDALRRQFLKEVEEKGEDAVHPADLKRVKNSDDWLRRFLLHHDLDEKLALGMLWETVLWRKDFKTNEISESNVRLDYIEEGAFFCRGRDKDGCKLLIFKCKKHVKGTKEFEDMQRCVVYWIERLEREENGHQITLFFDMEGCGLANMDLEFTKYLIGLFKQYYPYSLNYILIFEMAWILNAAFKIIKSWLPEKAVQRIKFLKKSNIDEFVPLDQALTCWGGKDDYTFSFVSEKVQENGTGDAVVENTAGNNRRVHFADGSPMSDTSGAVADKENEGMLSVQPSSVITFVKEGTELVSTVELQNIDATVNLTYKMKTTSPEKFRVRPSAGCLPPGGKATISVTLLPGFQLGGLSRDKFLVMSMPVDSTEYSSQELTDLWKVTSSKNVSQHRLRCAQVNDTPKNGNAISVTGSPSEGDQITQLSHTITKLTENHKKLQTTIRKLQILQLVTIVLTVGVGVILIYLFHSEFSGSGSSERGSCYREGSSP